MRIFRIVTSIIVLAWTASIASAGGGTAFTYQGRLLNAGEPANGLFDFEFGLWDAANGGNPIGVPQVLNNTPVADGLFTVQLDFGTEGFDNTDRWLEISVDGVPLMPRQPITRTPYAIQTRGIYVDADEHVGIGTTTPAHPLDVLGDVRAGERVAFGNDASIGSNGTFDFIFELSHIITDFSSNNNWDPLRSFITVDPGSDLVDADATYIYSHDFTTEIPSGNTHDVEYLQGPYLAAFHKGSGTVNFLAGGSIGAESFGGSVNTQYGAYFISDGVGTASIADNRAVDINSGHRGVGGSVADNHAVYIHSPFNDSPLTNHYGIYLEDQDFGENDSYAIYSDGGTSYFKGDIGIGTQFPDVPLHVDAGSDAELGEGGRLVLGPITGVNMAFDGNEIMARNNGAAATLSLNRDGGTVAISANAEGAVGIGTSAPESLLHLSSLGDIKLIIDADTNNSGGEDQNAGILLKQDGALVVGRLGYREGLNKLEIMQEYNEDLILGTSNQDRLTILPEGNVGIGATSPGAKLEVVSSTTDRAVWATSSTGGGVSFGVYAESTASNGTGMAGIANNGSAAWGIWGQSASGLAGKFSGDVDVTGTLSKSAGSFKIDHPLDPENKYLSHSFVESPDMMNIYNGNVVSDAEGYATLQLPGWFEALNCDFRYQLTVIDDADSADFVLTKIVHRIQNNQFTIRTSAPHTEVSWQVTGVRHDPYAEANRIPVEEDKPEELRSLYRHPELYGQSTEYSEDTYKLRAIDQVTEPEPAEHDASVQPQRDESTAAKMGRTLRDPEPDELARAASSTKGESR